VAELEIEGSFEEQWGAVKSAVKQHQTAIYGNGHGGLLEWASGVKAQFRLLVILITLFGVISGVGTVVVAILEYNRQAQHNMIHLPKVFPSQSSETAYSMRVQEAGNDHK
jgi:hypothetical protein